MEERETVFKATLKTPLIMTPTGRSPRSEASTADRREYRMGGKEESGEKPHEESQPIAPNVHIPERLGTQPSLNALAGKSMVGETFEMLLSSPAPSKQTTYLWCCKFWSKYCEARRVSPRLDPSKQDWDVEILNYLTWECSVVKIGGSGLETRFIARKFAHAVEGR